MLGLTLRMGDRVFIGPDGPDMVTVKVKNFRNDPKGGGRVELTFDAPRHIPIDREALREAKRAEQPAQPPPIPTGAVAQRHDSDGRISCWVSRAEYDVLMKMRHQEPRR